ncbi:hypothetical protein GPECTOR_13g841 [Gonium pectorale]|uniref:BTB domain-containing protein n=1 Tax=Gonium pectorale TaxID=33097 RepID=A0A150GND7_GONPE|nr:hypothetical protein GPECTOR_13g841 [Gonium pectorale]|eukprot:KXZ51353.1 hypothetical protein GPECTOR_13g841 [Gonium pectorale]
MAGVLQRLNIPSADVVTRRDASGRPQTLVFTSGPCVILPLEGGEEGKPFSLAPALELVDGPTGTTYSSLGGQNSYSPVYDPVSDCVYWKTGDAIMRMDCYNVVTSACSSVEVDGEGLVFSDTASRALTTDGRGALYAVAASPTRTPKCVVKVEVGDGRGANVTVYGTYESKIRDLVYDVAGDGLLATSSDGGISRLYKAVDGRLDKGPLKTSHTPGAPAVDGDGVMYFAVHISCLADDVYRVNLSSGQAAVSIGASCPPSIMSLAITPQGHLAACSSCNTLYILSCGVKLKPPVGLSTVPISRFLPPAAKGAAVASTAGSAGGMPQLLCSPTMTIVAGDRRFFAHRALLIHRSEYFRRLLESGFVESCSGEVRLEDTDPDMLGCLLQCLYSSVSTTTNSNTGASSSSSSSSGGASSGGANSARSVSSDVASAAVAAVPEPLLRPAAELAQQLLMRDVGSALQRRLLAAASPATVTSDLLWAEEHNLSELLGGLKEYFVRHARAAVDAAPEGLSALVAGSPELAAELFRSVLTRNGGVR